jgi:hypothetical protein
MKNIFIGLICGLIAAFTWFHTKGKINITETKTITNVVSIAETQIVEEVKYQYQYIPKTNEVWVTNIVEQILPTKIPNQPKLSLIQTVPPQTAQSVYQQTAPTPAPVPEISKPIGGMKGAKAAGRVTTVGNSKIKMGIKRNMDGSIK